MPYERTGYAPWSLTREAGVESATVDGTLQVPQYGQPVIDIGFVDEIGNWKGRKSDDRNFFAIQKDEAVANGGDFLTPSVNADDTWPLDMDGFRTVQVAIKATNAGNYKMTAVMGPDTVSFANLSPIDAASTLRLANGTPSTSNGAFAKALEDDAEVLTANVWEVFTIQDRLAGQKVLQFKITNNSGDVSSVETAFRRLV